MHNYLRSVLLLAGLAVAQGAISSTAQAMMSDYPDKQRLNNLSSPAGVTGDRQSPTLFHDDVVFQRVKYIKRTRGLTQSFRLNDEQLGTYKLSLLDYAFPAKFDELKLLLTWGVNEVMRVDGPGVYFFNAANPGKYFVNLWADTSDSYRIGLAGIKIELVENAAPVPLPASLVLLASALLLLIRYRRSRVGSSQGLVAA